MPKQNSELNEVLGLLKSAERILVVSHAKPDADAYGSSLGLTQILRGAGKTVACINETGLIDRYDFFPGIQELGTRIPAGNWDLAIACDCGTAVRIGDEIYADYIKFTPLLNIDHHISNSYFGTHNWVIPTASSTAEVVSDLAESLGAAVSAEAATCLLAGIYGDTGSFRYSSTTEHTFIVAHRLLTQGAQIGPIAEALFGSRKMAAVRIQSETFQNLELLAEGRISFIKADPAMYERCQATSLDTEGLVESARDIEGVQIACFIYNEGELWKVSMRSKSPALNVSAIAAEFGGGGHTQAAAFRWKQEYAELEKLLKARLIKAVNEAV